MVLTDVNEFIDLILLFDNIFFLFKISLSYTLILLKLENLTNNTIGNNIFDEIKVNNMDLPNKNNIVFDFFKEKKIKENNNNNIKINSKDEIYKE